MNAIHQLLTDHIDIWTAADTEKKSGRGRSSGNAAGVYGIKKLRELILELAVRGKLVQQDPNDEPASELLKRIQAEKAKLIAEGKIKKAKPLAEIIDDEKPFELPDGWEWTRLGEITNFGVTEKLELIFDDTWVLDLEDIEKDTSKLIQKFRFSERRSLSSKNSFQAGDVLYGKLRPYLNKVVVADEAGICTTEILPIRCYGPFNSNYFKFALKSPYFINYVNARSYGMKMPRLGTEDGRRAYFPLPPLADQHRIVAKVDELMTLCDQLETQHSNAAEAHEKLVSHLLGTLTQSSNTTTSPLCKRGAGGDLDWQRVAAHFDTLFTTEASIDALKQTLLQLAVMGKLVPQDPNDEPASELLKRYDISSTPSFIAGWSKVSLGVLGDIYGGATPSKAKPEYWVGNVPWISPKDMKRFYINNAEDNVSEGAICETALKLIPEGSLLMVVRGMILAHSFPVALTTSKVTINQDMKALVVPEEVKEYMLLYIRAMKNSFVALVDRSSHGTCKLVSSKLWSVMVECPPEAEQHRIVAKVDELMAICDQLKSRITKANQLQQKLADVVVEQAIS
ncbi:MAG: restriction endonuclease subunit S [Methylobacter sp.]|nr:restriction endonuclease subunit S [Methylobacter sp.]